MGTPQAEQNIGSTVGECVSSEPIEKHTDTAECEKCTMVVCFSEEPRDPRGHFLRDHQGDQGRLHDEGVSCGLRV